MKRVYAGMAAMGALVWSTFAWSAASADSLPKWTANIPVKVAQHFAFDTSATADGKYYLADGSNAALDVFDAKTMTLLAQIPGDFAGVGKSFDTSAPAGVTPVPGTSLVYVGDVNAVKLIDVSEKKLVKTIAVSTSGLRADEGCLDAEHHVVMYSSGGEKPPFATFIDTRTQAVVGKLTLPDSTGLEACGYDPKNRNFMLNNDGTKAHPKGEVDLIPVASVLAGKPRVSHVFGLEGCGAPTGIAIGPRNDALIGCDPDEGGKQTTLIIDRSSGRTLAELPFGGVDQVTYDPVSKRYFLPAGHRSADGISQVGRKDAKFDSALGVVDAVTRRLLGSVPTGVHAHSVAVDGKLNRVFVPQAGGADAEFSSPGVSVFTAR
ncbi:hypothetical protein [Paraburkholderia sp.]|uniref:YncE family protein n=1 Tax=Paraburkholderia sp. TaxID=1926495 RepID=UPI003D6DFB7A